MTRRSMPCLFHANLFALDVARCRCQNIGVAGVVVGDVLKRLPNGYCAHVSHDSRLFYVSFSCLCPSSTCGVALVGTSYSTATYGVGGIIGALHLHKLNAYEACAVRVRVVPPHK